MITQPKETLKRSVGKIVSHRIGSLMITFTVLAIMGAGLADSIGYTLAINGAKTVAALFYERVWVRFDWGYKE